jgi:hypothetical protein
MLTDSEKSEFALSTIRPMAEFTLPCVTQVIGVLDEHQGEFLGTSLYCSLDGRQAVVTAAHVLREARASGKYDSLAFTRGSEQAPGIVAGLIHYFDEFDLAIYRPERDFFIGGDKSYWPEERIERTIAPAKTDYLFMQGFPARFARFSTLLKGGVSESLSLGAMMRLEVGEESTQGQPPSVGADLPRGLLQEHEFAFDFSPDSNFIDEPGQPLSESDQEDWREIFTPGDGMTLPGQKRAGAFGLSGSPVWRVGASDHPIQSWNPQACQLVGIVTSWNPEWGVLIATSSAKLLQVVAQI